MKDTGGDTHRTGSSNTCQYTAREDEDYIAPVNLESREKENGSFALG